MSDFLANFRSFFSEEERKSELYRILASIGVNTEKAILEELNAEIRRSTEASVFSENKLRSWLAFFLTPVRNVVSASGFGRAVVTSIEGSDLTFATVAAGSVISGSNGMQYQIQEDLTLNLGCSTPFTFIQGTESTYNTTYSEFIAIPVSGDVDLSDIKVFLNGSLVSLPLVPSFPSFPEDLSKLFPSLSVDMSSIMAGYAGYAGDASGDFSLWNPLINNLKSLWDSVQAVSIRPVSGFFPFLFNNTLFIKIFPGGYLGSDNYVPDPSGQPVSVRYRISNGAFGNLKKNQLESFSSAITTSDGGTVAVDLFNEDTANGVNAPSHAELVNLFRRRCYASSHVSSIPEYTTWFLSQPEVGDCLVISDFERWRLSGKATSSGFDIKGFVEVYLVDSFGNPIVPREQAADPYSDFIQGLENKLEGVRDLAFLKYEAPVVYWHFFVVQFRSVSSETEFIANASTVLSNLYSLSWVQSNGSSLFRDLDMDNITNAIRGDFNISGLRVFPYHYYELSNSFFSASSKFVLFSHYFGEKAGGWYEYWERDENGDLGSYVRDSNDLLSFDSAGVITNGFLKGIPHALYKEFVDPVGVCHIYRYSKRFIYNDKGIVSSWAWSTLWSSPESSEVGSRKNGAITFDMKGLAPGVLRCFWSIANEGSIPVGNSLTSGFGIRKLPSEHSVLTNGTFFGESARFEKSI